MSGNTVHPEQLLDSAARGAGSSRVAELLLDRSRADGLEPRIRLGTCTARSVSAHTADVTVSGVAVPGLQVLGQMPAVGSVVVLLQTSGAYAVLGTLGAGIEGGSGAYALRRSSTGQIISNNAEELVLWPTAVSLAGITHAAGVFTIPADGRYTVDAGLTWVSSAVGIRSARVAVNGSTFLLVNSGAASTGLSGASISATLALNAGDTVSILAYQQSGGVLALSTGTTANWVTISYVGPLA